ncbi:hypothetical protein AALP_AA8G200600 [Arabis alpina]|uniref:Uncharacterized protein n=1 Tax=Arabis alpina TaxID=50452 RepID=A0A087G881_ARAAL|nr:hypothetical protein AALP_AA8G200600 [Arabis alpina]
MWRLSAAISWLLPEKVTCFRPVCSSRLSSIIAKMNKYDVVISLCE